MTVANGCGKNGGGAKPCDLLEFVQFINHDGKKPVLNMKNAPKGWDPVDLKPEHVDWTARALRDAGATGVYDPNKIFKGVSRMGVDSLFTRVANFIGGGAAVDDIPPNSLACAKKAVGVWASLRKWAQGIYFKAELEKKYKDALEKQYPKDPELVWTDKPVGETGEKVKTMDVGESVKKLRTLPGMEKYIPIHDFKEWIKDKPSHNTKVGLANDAIDSINGECG